MHLDQEIMVDLVRNLMSQTITHLVIKEGYNIGQSYLRPKYGRTQEIGRVKVTITGLQILTLT